jgi:hypothetical protein
MKTISKLANFFDKAIKVDARQALITGSNGEYTVYGRYYIKPLNGDYQVYDINTKESIILSSLKHAMTWCTLTDCKQHNQAKRLEALDLKLISIKLDMAIHKKLVKLSTSDNRLVYSIKLQEDSYRKKAVVSEIDQLINKSKTLQELRFQKPKPNKFSYW